jgi:chaperonin GroES
MKRVPERRVKDMLRPLEDYVVLTMKKEEKTTQSGIILTTEEKDKPAIGSVLSVGPKVENLKVDDEVIYQTYSGTKVKLEDQEYLIIQAKNILAILEK